MKISYKKKYRRIKKFVKFKHDLRLSEKNFEKKLSLSEKRRISYYYKILFGERGTDQEQGVVNQDYYDYRPRSEKNKKLAAKYAQIKGGYKDLKIIPIPRADKNSNIKLKFKNNELQVIEGNIKRKIQYFNMKELAKNPKKEVYKAVKRLKETGEIDAILPLAGYREILENGIAEDEEVIADNIISLMQKYSENFQKWLLGLAGYEFIKQESFFDYVEERKKSNKKRRCKKCKKVLSSKDINKKQCQKCKTKISK